MERDFAMIRRVGIARLLHVAMMVVSCWIAAFSQNQRDLVKGNLIQFNDNGAWCWYQDERVVVDAARGNLILGTDASASGVGGSPRSGDVEAVIYDLQAGVPQRFTLREGESRVFYCDDHNSPAFLIRQDGKYLAMYAAHFNDTSSYYRIYDAGVWGAETRFNWKTERPGGANFQTTYSNLFYLSAEGRTYNFVRGNNKSPNLMFSTDMGDTWSYGGQLTTNANIGYNNGYYKYWSNGVDRIDFICSDYHPRDYNTSIFHGYVKNGETYTSDGIVVDDNIFDPLTVPSTADLTTVFAANSVLQGITMTRCWNIDVQTYEDGTIATIIKARANDNPANPSQDPDNRFIYCRYDGSKWTSTYLGKAGKKLYGSEQDYTGLAALHPNDPNTIYISSTFDPRDSSSVGVHEIFKGVTADNGATWTWIPITQKSVRDNLRPVIPAWDENNTALLWWRGTYTSAQNFNAAVVGILDRRSETVGPMSYVDATSANTLLADGSTLVTTGPDSLAGPADNTWHQRMGFGNGGFVLTSAEVGSGENAPMLKTRVSAPSAGAYDVWVNFWANPTADWRIKAGLTVGGMQLFRQMACKQVEVGDHNATIVLTGSGNTFLYQAYLGRVQLSTESEFDVYVDDEAIRVGTPSTFTGDVARTWYDGISYARVGPVVSVTERDTDPRDFVLEQNYPNPFNPMTTIRYSLPQNVHVNLKVYDLLGQEVATLVSKDMPAGTHDVTWHAQNASSGVYFCRMAAGKFSKVTRMLVLK